MAPTPSTSSLSRPPHHHLFPTVLNRLSTLFPSADPGFLSQAATHHITLSLSSGLGWGVEDVVQRVTEKMFEMGKEGEWPRVVWMRKEEVGVRNGGAEEVRNEGKGKGKGKQSGRIAGMGEVRKTWKGLKERRGSKEREKEGREDAEEVRVVDETLGRNLALVRLHAMFPTTPIAALRNVLLSLPHSFLHAAVDQLLLSPPPITEAPPRVTLYTLFFGRRRTTSTTALEADPGLPVLRPSDLFRSAAHQRAMVSHLSTLYPHIPLEKITELVSTEGSTTHSYPEIEQLLSIHQVRQPLLKSLFNNFFPPSPPTPSTSSKPTLTPSTLSPSSFALLSHDLLPSLRLQLLTDRAFAQSLNTEWTPSSQLITCECCFDTVPFESLCICSTPSPKPPHVFCTQCLERQVDQHLFGGMPFKGEVACLSMEGCENGFGMDEVERVLGGEKRRGLEREWANREVEKAGELGRKKAVRCGACGYFEWRADGEEGEEGDRMWWCSLPVARRGVEEMIWTMPHALFSTFFILLPLLFFTFFLIFFQPNLFIAFQPRRAGGHQPQLFPLLEPHLVFLTSLAYLTSHLTRQQASKTHRNPFFHCRNTPSFLPPSSSLPSSLSSIDSNTSLIALLWPQDSLTTSTAEETCGKTTCLICSRIVPNEEIHRCWIEERDGLRLAVEKAMTDAVKRDCAKCGVGFTKSDGCNKMVCRCGTATCYVCRKEIGDEGYAHFCQHFRPTFGLDCPSCTRCSLWVAPDDTLAASKAAAAAKEDWIAAATAETQRQAQSIARLEGKIGPDGVIGAPEDVGEALFAILERAVQRGFEFVFE